MADVLRESQRSFRMSLALSPNTPSVMILRRALWSCGLRYRINHRIGRRSLELVFVTARVAEFVDSCFWHQYPLHGIMPKSDRGFWKMKLIQNIKRDTETSEELKKARWTVIRFWEQEIEDSAYTFVRTIVEVLKKRLSIIRNTYE